MKYIAYCRKSTDEKDKQVLSIDQQIAELKEFAERSNIQISEFVTEAKTAKVPGREKFGEIVKRIEKGEIQGIVSWHPDRLARNSIDGGRLIYLLDTGKLLDLKFPSFWFENSPQGKFVLNIAFGQSKYYVDNLSENVKRGLRHKIRLGIWPVQAPLGYLNDKATKTVIIDPMKAKVIKKSFEMFANERKSFTSISKFLFENGFKMGSGKRLRVNRIRCFLSNPFYIGILKFKGELYPGKQKVLISKELFTKAQKQIQRIERPRYNGHNFPFIGLARCGECGAAITAEEHKKILRGTKEKVTYIYYRCTKKLKPCNQSRYTSQEDLTKQLRKSILDIAIPDSWKETWLNLLEKDKEKEQTKIQENLQNNETETQSAETKLNKLLDAYLDGTIEEEAYKTKKNELFNKKLELQDKIAKIKTNGSNWLEPFESFIKQVVQARKIASSKNNHKELAEFVRSAGSNFSLTDNRLVFTPNLGFDSVQSLVGRAHPANDSYSMFQSVTPLEFESKFSE